MKSQREMGFHAVLTPPKLAPQSVIASFDSYREAVVWCWEHRINTGAGEKADQAMCANQIGLHTPHMSRCVNRDSQAPMNLSPDHLQGFEYFCGWRAASQFVASKAQMPMFTEAQLALLSQIIEQGRAVA